MLPLRIETGRYERPRREASERTCVQCDVGAIEDETHFLLHCPRHTLLRAELYSEIKNLNFYDLSDIEKLKFLLNNPDIVKPTAKFISKAFNNRCIE